MSNFHVHSLSYHSDNYNNLRTSAVHSPAKLLHLQPKRSIYYCQFMRSFFQFLLFLLLGGTIMSCSGSKKQGSIVSTATSVSATNPVLSQQFGVPVPANANIKLAEEVLLWKGTPYKLGGTSKSGVDCSGFICQVYPIVYRVQPPRTTVDMHKLAKPVETNDIREGDIVFFSIGSSKPSHSGIYLWNGYFAHASTTKGVMLSNLAEAYWTKYFTGAGRLVTTKPSL